MVILAWLASLPNAFTAFRLGLTAVTLAALARSGA
jgi:hypothetical protein